MGCWFKENPQFLRSTYFYVRSFQILLGENWMQLEIKFRQEKKNRADFFSWTLDAFCEKATPCVELLPILCIFGFLPYFLILKLLLNVLGSRIPSSMWCCTFFEGERWPDLSINGQMLDIPPRHEFEKYSTQNTEFNLAGEEIMPKKYSFASKKCITGNWTMCFLVKAPCILFLY